MVVSGVLRRWRFVLAAAEVAATAATTTAIAARDDTAYEEDGLACGRCDHEVCVDILLTKLFGDIQPEGTVVVVDIPLGQVTENGMRPIHLFELI